MRICSGATNHRWADRFDCKVLREERAPGDWQQSLALAACDLAEGQIHTLVVVPGDLPALTPPDIDLLLARHTADITVVPAARDGGTNAIVMTPPNAMGFVFGPDSARRHIEAATRKGLRSLTTLLSAFAEDIDTPDDLARFCLSGTTSASRLYLERSGIAARLRSELEAAG